MEDFWNPIILIIREKSEFTLKNAAARKIGGGCINEAYLIESGSGPGIFIKVNAAEKLPMFEAEAEALNALAATGTIRTPRPICCGSSGRKAFLALEAVALSSRSDSVSQAKMGRQLAELHRATSENRQFGWHRDNTIGELPQSNPWTNSWADFFGRHRLAVQFELAAENGRSFRKAGELLRRIPDLLDGHGPPPSLLHGDLWGGNAGFDSKGEPVIFDPATYYGDRETDLAFTEMFGGFGPAFYESYRAAWPLDPGYEFRKQLYNLYHVLNHHNHFGGGYAARAESIIDRLVSN